MKFRYIKSILSAASLLLAVSVTSCIGDLDATPIDPNIVMTRQAFLTRYMEPSD